MKPLLTPVILALLTLTGLGQPTLPAEREITDTAGRKMTGTVLSKSDPNAGVDTPSIKFRRAADGKEFDIPLEKLSKADIGWLNAPITPVPANKPVETPEPKQSSKTETFPYEIQIPLYLDGRPVGETKIPANEPVTVVRNNGKSITILKNKQEVNFKIPTEGTPAKASALQEGKHHPVAGLTVAEAIRQIKEEGRASHICWAFGAAQHTYWRKDRERDYRCAEFARKNKIRRPLETDPLTSLWVLRYANPGTKEAYSLLPEFRKLKVAHLDQGDTPLCGLYSGYHLLDYEYKKAGMTTPPFETLAQKVAFMKTLRNSNGDTVGELDLDWAFPQITTHPHYLGKSKFPDAFGHSIHRELQVEWIKAQIKQNRAVYTGVNGQRYPEGHWILLVGFKSDGTYQGTTFEGYDTRSNMTTVTTSEVTEAMCYYFPSKK